MFAELAPKLRGRRWLDIIPIMARQKRPAFSTWNACNVAPRARPGLASPREHCGRLWRSRRRRLRSRRYLQPGRAAERSYDVESAIRWAGECVEPDAAATSAFNNIASVWNRRGCRQ